MSEPAGAAVVPGPALATVVFLESIRHCPRCSGAHPNLGFRKLYRPIAQWTFWAPCPTYGEPILFRTETAAGKLDTRETVEI